MSEKGRRGNNQGTISAYLNKAGEERYRIYYWVPSNHDGESAKRKSKRNFLTRDAAEEALETIRVDLRRGQHNEASKDTLDGFAALYLDNMEGTVKPSTLSVYRRHYRVHISSELGPRKMSSISPDELTRHYRRLINNGRKDGREAGLSPTTVKHVHTLLVQILGAAVAKGLIVVNPAKGATVPRLSSVAPREMTVWSSSQVRQFLLWSKASNDPLYVAWRLLFATGLRRGELLALRWQDVNLSREVVTVKRSLTITRDLGVSNKIEIGSPKNGRGRVVDLDADTVVDLESQRVKLMLLDKSAVGQSEYVLQNRHRKHLHPDRFSTQFKERIAKAIEAGLDLPMIHVHEARHTHATMLLEAGEHPRVVQERLGHSDISITLGTYSHVTATLQKGAATATGRALSLA